MAEEADLKSFMTNKNKFKLTKFKERRHSKNGLMNGDCFTSTLPPKQPSGNDTTKVLKNKFKNIKVLYVNKKGSSLNNAADSLNEPKSNDSPTENTMNNSAKWRSTSGDIKASSKIRMSDADFKQDSEPSKRKFSSYVFQREKETPKNSNHHIDSRSSTSNTKGNSDNCLQFRSEESQKSWEADGICTQDSPPSNNEAVLFEDFVESVRRRLESKEFL